MDEILIILKALTGTTESDAVLTKLIITSAIIVKSELTFDINYIISITNETITPNPEDNAFILLVAYKASILLLQTEIKSASGQSIKIVDGPSSIDLTSRTKEFSAFLSGLLSEYFNLKRDYILNGANGLGFAVITPTTYYRNIGNNFS